MYNLISNMRDSLGSAGVEAFIAILIVITGILVLACGVFQFLTFRKLSKLNDEVEKLKGGYYTGAVSEVAVMSAADENITQMQDGKEDENNVLYVAEQPAGADEPVFEEEPAEEREERRTDIDNEEKTVELQPAEEEKAEDIYEEIYVEFQPAGEQSVKEQPAEEFYVEEQPAEEQPIKEQPAQEFYAEEQHVGDFSGIEEEIEQLQKDEVEPLQEEENISITEIPVSEVAEAAIEVAGDAVQTDDTQAGIVVTPDVKMDYDESEVMNFNMTTHSINSDTIEMPAEEFGKGYGVELEKLFGSAAEQDTTDIFSDAASESGDVSIKEDRMRAMEQFSDTFHAGTDSAQEILEAVRKNDEAKAEADTMAEAKQVEEGFYSDTNWNSNGADELSFDEKLKRALMEAEEVANTESEKAVSREELEKQIQI